MRNAELYEQFTKERKHLNNVSSKTFEWYKYSFRAFEPHLADTSTDNPMLRGVFKRAAIAL